MAVIVLDEETMIFGRAPKTSLRPFVLALVVGGLWMYFKGR